MWKVEGDGKKVRNGEDDLINFSELGKLCWRLCVCACTLANYVCTREVSLYYSLLRSPLPFPSIFNICRVEYINKPETVEQDKPSRIRMGFWSSFKKKRYFKTLSNDLFYYLMLLFFK